MAYNNYDYDSNYSSSNKDRDNNRLTDEPDTRSGRNWLAAALTVLGVAAIGFFVANYVYNPFTAGTDQDRINVSQNIVPGTTDDSTAISPGTDTSGITGTDDGTDIARDTGTNGSAGSATQPGTSDQNVATQTPTFGEDQRLEMRKLWTDHGVWFRSYAVSALGNLPDADETLNRLKRNVQEIAAAIESQYGANTNANTNSSIRTLLDEHVTIAVDYISAARTNNQSTMSEAQNRLMANADQIDSYFNTLNISGQTGSANLSGMFREHASHDVELIQARVRRDYDSEISLADRALEHLLQLADRLSGNFNNAGGTNVPTTSPTPTPDQPSPAPSPAPSGNGSIR